MTAVWSKVMEQLIGALRNEKLSLSLISLLLASGWAAWAWANGEFVKQTEFDSLKKLMVEHTEEFRIVTAAQIIRDLELKLQVAQATQESDAEIRHLQDEIDKAYQYRACLIERKPNCQHLKPPG